jgi:electron transport complex protein RnfG
VVRNVIFAENSAMVEVASADKDVNSLLRVVDAAGETVGYEVEMVAVSRSGPFEILVVLDENAKVLDTQVIMYRAQRGRQVRSKSFTEQFKGKCPTDPVELGTDIDAVTKATLSSKAMARAVKKAILLVQKIAEK